MTNKLTNIPVIFPLDSAKKFIDQSIIGHNRWHPDIPVCGTMEHDTTYRVFCREWLDGAIEDSDSAEDIRDCDFSIAHPLSGPFNIPKAKPGDLLVVDIIDVGPLSEDHGSLAGQGWGYTGIFAKNNGGGFLTDYFPDAYKAVWDFKDGYASSRHIPGLKFKGNIHIGLMGTAPSTQLLNSWNSREGKLISTDPNRIPALALPPLEKGAILGSLTGADLTAVSQTAARTAPPRENGGNQDIKNLTKGSRIYYPVFVDGAKLSLGDLHYAQGDGEITFCGAIEMGGYVDLRVSIIKNGMSKYGVGENTIFQPGYSEVQYTKWLAFSGTSVTLDGEQRYMDTTLAYQRACLHAIDYLETFGYSREQGYLILGAAPIEGRISGIVDIPNSCATVYLPTEIFDFDLTPSNDGPKLIKSNSFAPKATIKNQ